LLEVLNDEDGPVLMDTVDPTGFSRFTRYASPKILVISMAATKVRDAAAAAAKGDARSGIAGRDGEKFRLPDTSLDLSAN